MKNFLSANRILTATALGGLTVLTSAAIAGGHPPRPAGSACCGAASGTSQVHPYYAGQVMSPDHADFGYPQPGFLSGYEGLPSMDGGGVHPRYPYHSYRRPWFHPGPASANISIVW